MTRRASLNGLFTNALKARNRQILQVKTSTVRALSERPNELQVMLPKVTSKLY
jgi:hypothetical protein